MSKYESTDGSLSRKQKQHSERIAKYLFAFAQTPEGMQKIDEAIALLSPPRKTAPVALTKQEERAVRFIRKELKNKRIPSVRGVTKAMGLRSSRSGHRILQQLIAKGVLSREGGRYVLLGSAYPPLFQSGVKRAINKHGGYCCI